MSFLPLLLILNAVVAAGAEPEEPSDVIVQLLYRPPNCTDSDIAKEGDVMHVQYLGRFYESKESFDSSYARDNVPFYYTLGGGGVIEGYQRGTKEMCLNERRRLIVPSKYAYGSRGTGNIPGYATLMFDVHLVQINDSPPPYPVPLELPKEVTSTGPRNCETPVAAGDLVEVAYAGWLPDGKVFDEGEGLRFVVGAGQVLAGVDEGVVGYCAGGDDGHIRLEIPPVKGHGDRWGGPVPQWSYVYYNISITQHTPRHPQGGEAEDEEVRCEEVTRPSCNYRVAPGDYVLLKYTVLAEDGEGGPGEELGSSEMRYPVGRGLFVPGWDDVIVGSCPREERLCRIPGSRAHPIGISLFLAPPKTPFYCRLEVVKVLLTSDDRDQVDLDREEKEGAKESVENSAEEVATVHTEL